MNLSDSETTKITFTSTPNSGDDISPNHPRCHSLRARVLVTTGVEQGIVSRDGLIAHGRGEAFDYLIGEITNVFATSAIQAAAAKILLSKKVAISINGNTAALVGKDIEKLRVAASAVCEVNLFHPSLEREQRIRDHLLSLGVEEVLLPSPDSILPGIDSNRKFMNSDGLLAADTVIVALEDNDKCEALKKLGKFVIAIDLNPLCRTAKKADITIVDNLVRVFPRLAEKLLEFRGSAKSRLEDILNAYRNDLILTHAESKIRRG